MLIIRALPRALPGCINVSLSASQALRPYRSSAKEASTLPPKTMSTYKKLDSPKGLIFVYSDPGAVPDDEFNDWYNNEHIPPRLNVTGILTSARYKAVDSKSPSWLALYDITSPEVVETPEYKALIPNASQREKQIMGNLATINRRTYGHVSGGAYIHPQTDPSSLPSPYLLVVHMKVTLEGEEEFNRWYNEEHMIMISQVPGWLCGRRYKLLDSVSRGVRIKPAEGEQPYADYVAIHDMTTNDFMELPEFKTATQTPWRERIMQQVIHRDIRIFERYKVFKTMS